LKKNTDKLDPDPIRLFHILPTTNLLIVVSAIHFLLLALVFLAFYLLIIISLSELWFLALDMEELEELSLEDKGSFQKVSTLFHKAHSLDILFALAKLFLSVLLIFSLYYLHNAFELSLMVFSGVAFILLLSAIYLIPKLVVKFQEQNRIFGLSWSYHFLNFCIPLTNFFVEPKDQRPSSEISMEELKSALPEEEQEGISKANLNLYRQIFRFDKLIIKQVMRPKSELQGIKSNYNFKEVLQKINSSQFSRLPVYEGSWNKVLGIIHCKDLLPHTGKEKLDWKNRIRPILYVQERDNAQQVLRQFQQSKNHMALVLNSNKRLVGLVTLEDITEEIIGEIEDE